MVIYRPHRYLLAEAMAEAREFETLDEMKTYVADWWAEANDGIRMFEPEDVVLSGNVRADHRIGWRDVRNVCVRRFGGEDHSACPMAIGFCSTDYDKPKK